MIDRIARRQAAELLRHFAAGQITNDQFEDQFPKVSGDAAVGTMGSQAWFRTTTFESIG